MPQKPLRKKLRTAAIASTIGCLGLVVLFFGSAFVSALLEVIGTLRENGAESKQAAQPSQSVDNPGELTNTADKPSLDMDMRVNEQGTLTVTETLSMPALEKALPGEGGYTRTLYKFGRDDSRAESADYPARKFELEILAATCDGVSVPYYVHDSKKLVRFCVDPPEGADLKAPHVYAITYATTKDLYYPVWKRFQQLVFTALYNEYDIPIEHVRVRIEFPEDVALSRRRIDAGTGHGYKDKWRDLQGWDGNTNDYEVALDAPNVVTLQTTTPLYGTETFVFRVFIPKGSVERPFNVSVVLDIVFGCMVIALIVFIPGTIIYVSITQSREPVEDGTQEAETHDDSLTSKEASVTPAASAGKPWSHARVLTVSLVAVLVMLFGGLIVYEMTVYPLMQRHAGKSWQETPCRIVDLGRTLRYDYEWDGHTYSSNQYDLGPFGRGVRENFQKIKQDTPIGSETVCYVNPADPHQAVLSHKLKSGYFFGVGAGGFIFLIGLALLGWTVSETAD
jgi:hypothetical protein